MDLDPILWVHSLIVFGAIVAFTFVPGLFGLVLLDHEKFALTPAARKRAREDSIVQLEAANRLWSEHNDALIESSRRISQVTEDIYLDDEDYDVQTPQKNIVY